MEITKQAFGRFLTECRRDSQLTQRQLAERLHVSESAVSKWERGRSYPDVTMIRSLAGALNVSTQELISASEDRAGRAEREDARAYRSWRSAILWTTGVTWVLAVLAAFIVNLSVQHTLSWFWVVLWAVGIAFSLTTLPLLRLPAPGWLALAGATLSVCALLGTVWLLYARGNWLTIAISAILLGIVVVFTPVGLTTLQLPGTLGRHAVVLSLIVCTIAVLTFLLVVLLVIGRFDLWLWPAVPLVAIGATPVWIVAIVLRYTRMSALAAASVVAVIIGISVYAIDFAVAAVLGEPFAGPANLLFWNADTIEPNVRLLTSLTAMLVALLLAVAAVLRQRRGRVAEA